jgi:hypothetical protein
LWAAIAAFTGVAVLYFDLGPPVPFVDDAVYAWYVRSLAAGRGLVSYPDFVPLALTHRVLGLVGTLGHPDLRLLRLTVFPFLLFAGWATYRLARRLGAAPGWSAVAALALAANPITLSLATSFMTDVVFMGLLAVACLFGLSWITASRQQGLMVAATLLAVGERQIGVSAAVGITVALWLRARRGGRLTRADQAWLMALWTGTAVLSALSWRLGAQPTASVGAGLFTSSAVEARQLADWLVFAPGMCGLVFLPFLPVLVRRAIDQRTAGAAWVKVAGVLTAIAVAAVALVGAGGLVPSGHLNLYGLGPQAVSRFGYGSLRLGHPVIQLPKPVVFSPALLLAVSVAGVATSCVALYCAAGRRAWTRSLMDPVVVFLFLTALVQVPLLALVSHYDRYYLSALAPLLPLAAQRASAWSSPGWSAAAAPVIVGGLLLYVVGQQDYEAWQAARDAVARQLYTQVDPASVDAGWETNFQYSWIPAFEAGRKMSAPTRFHLEFAPPGDPRPGRDYSSVSPGRIVVASGEAPVAP